MPPGHDLPPSRPGFTLDWQLTAARRPERPGRRRRRSSAARGGFGAPWARRSYRVRYCVCGGAAILRREGRWEEPREAESRAGAGPGPPEEGVASDGAWLLPGRGFCRGVALHCPARPRPGRSPLVLGAAAPAPSFHVPRPAPRVPNTDTGDRARHNLGFMAQDADSGGRCQPCYHPPASLGDPCELVVSVPRPPERRPRCTGAGRGSGGGGGQASGSMPGSIYPRPSSRGRALAGACCRWRPGKGKGVGRGGGSRGVPPPPPHVLLSGRISAGCPVPAC